MATVILVFGAPKGVKSEDYKELKDETSGLFTSHNNIVPGDSQNDIRLRDEQAKLELEKKKRETIAREKRYYGTGSGNTYAKGNCTWYAKEKSSVVINGWGDAKYWPANSVNPQVGGVVKTNESWRGHVAYVEAIKEGSIIISEMNYLGLGIVSRRELQLNSSVIVGYIN